ncbi:GSCOCG00013389001-RA-CDS, partial [Cotesia congregata]
QQVVLCSTQVLSVLCSVFCIFSKCRLVIGINQHLVHHYLFHRNLLLSLFFVSVAVVLISRTVSLVYENHICKYVLPHDLNLI